MNPQRPEEPFRVTQNMSPVVLKNKLLIETDNLNSLLKL